MTRFIGGLFLTVCIAMLIMLGLTSLISAQDKADYTECPAGYFWRGACVQVTGCPNGDSIPVDSPKCGNEPAPVANTKVTEVPDYTALPDFQGK